VVPDEFRRVEAVPGVLVALSSAAQPREVTSLVTENAARIRAIARRRRVRRLAVFG
jgi:hypothetical protein